jgi:hypothetical protein
VLDWSYRSLERDEARLFRLFGLAGCEDLPFDAVVAMAGRPAVEVRRSLSRLVDQHLLDRFVDRRTAAARAGQRWRMHDLLQLLALQHAADDPDTIGARRRLWDWYAFQGARAREVVAPDLTGVLPSPLPEDPPTLTAASAWLAVEAPNLLDLAEQALRHGAPEVARGLLLVLGGFMVDPVGRVRKRDLLSTLTEATRDVALKLELAESDLRDGEATVELAELVAAETNPTTTPPLRVLAKLLRLRCLMQLGHFEEAEATEREMLLGSPTDVGIATAMGLLDIGTQLAAVRHGAPEALAAGNRALDVQHSPVLRYRSLTAVAIAWQRAGLLAQARQLRLEAAELAAGLGSIGWAVHSWVIASRLSQRMGRLEVAAQDAAEGVRVAERLDPGDDLGYSAAIRALLAELTAS